MLPTPSTAAGRAGLAALIRHPDRALIAVDYDGTLAPPPPQAVAALRRLAGYVATVAVITGRPAAEAIGVGGIDEVPDVIVMGHYGRERWESGKLSSEPVPPGVAQAREELPRVLAAAGAPDGTWAEDKAGALGVHTRRTAEPGPALDRLR